MTIVALHGGAWTTQRQTDCWFEAFQSIIYMCNPATMEMTLSEALN